MGFPDAQKLLENTRREVNAGESFFEFRLDYLAAPEQGIAVIRKFLAAHPDCCILATCRRHQNHGKFTAAWRIRFAFWMQRWNAGARAVDIEIESAENAVPRLEALRGKGQLVLSYHNYDGTPSPERCCAACCRISADGYKIVTTARKPSDNSRLLALTKIAHAYAAHRVGDGRNGISDARTGHRVGRNVTYAARILPKAPLPAR